MNDEDHGTDPARSHDAAHTGNAAEDTPLDAMWASSFNEINAIDPQTENWKIQTLPLARVKKIMKSEEFITQELAREKAQQEGNIDDKPSTKFMISSEAPLLMSKACELLIQELSSRAWQHTVRNRRRTLQRQDIHAAVGESEVFDFLIDIVPRVPTQTPRHSIPSSIPPEAASMPMSVPGIPSIHQAQAFASVPTLQHPAHDFDPMHGQFPFFNPLSIPGMESTDGSSMGVGVGVMTFPGHHHAPPQQPHPGQLLQQQPPPPQPQEQQHIKQEQQQSLPQWTDPPV